mmetsp:Transcript_31100/g.80299  ORF Transcript_31100/g.80299 Transcript_31100/m.80299 type:complete len:247 (-) Transcript_31100:744-1484(-)
MPTASCLVLESLPLAAAARFGAQRAEIGDQQGPLLAEGPKCAPRPPRHLLHRLMRLPSSLAPCRLVAFVPLAQPLLAPPELGRHAPSNVAAGQVERTREPPALEQHLVGEAALEQQQARAPWGGLAQAGGRLMMWPVAFRTSLRRQARQGGGSRHWRRILRRRCPGLELLRVQCITKETDLRLDAIEVADHALRLGRRKRVVLLRHAERHRGRCRARLRLRQPPLHAPGLPLDPVGAHLRLRCSGI